MIILARPLRSVGITERVVCLLRDAVPVRIGKGLSEYIFVDLEGLFVETIEPEIVLSIRGLYKVFADDNGTGLNQAVDGRSKDEIQENTGAVVGLRDVTVDIARGELFVVMGLSGCGKSTLVRCINRLIEPSAGQVWLNGREITAMDPEELREIRRTELAMVFQHFGLMPHRNVLDNVALPLEVGGMVKAERRERAAASLELVGLGDWAGSMPSQLSGGMKQRVGLARGLAMNTPVLLMDEPFSALDPVIRRDLQDELLALQESVHKTIVFITHDLNEAVRVGDRIAIMRDGEVVQLGAPNDVVLNPADSFVREFTQDVRLHGMVTAASIMDTEFETIRDTASVNELVDRLESPDTNSLCCVDAQGHYLGKSDLARARRAQRNGAKTVEEVTLYIGDHVGTDAVLDDLVPAGLRAQYPLAVVDDDDMLVGVIPLNRLARAMVSDQAAAEIAADQEVGS